MQDTLRALQALQELDQEIFKLREELRRLPHERDQRRARIDAAIERRDGVARVVAELRTRIKEIEDMTTIQRQRLRKVEQEAANSRGDMALLAAYQHQLKTLKRGISSAEEEGLGLVEEAETHDHKRSSLTAEIDAAEVVYAEFNANAEAEIAVASKRLEELEAERAQRMSNEISAENLTLYDKLLKAETESAKAQKDLEEFMAQAGKAKAPAIWIK